MSDTAKQPIVVLGGMGPQASSQLYKLLIDQAIERHKVVENEDFPFVVLESLPVPEFFSGQSRRAEAIAIMHRAITSAESYDPVAVGMACNTAHLFADDILEGAAVPFVSLIEVVAETVKGKGIKRIGLVASPTTIQTGLYKKALDERGIDCLTPTEQQQDELSAIIHEVIAGKASRKEAVKLEAIAKELIDQGAEGVILGCTELPLVFPKGEVEYPAFDCLELLADELLKRYYDRYPVSNSD